MEGALKKTTIEVINQLINKKQKPSTEIQALISTLEREESLSKTPEIFAC